MASRIGFSLQRIAQRSLQPSQQGVRTMQRAMSTGPSSTPPQKNILQLSEEFAIHRLLRVPQIRQAASHMMTKPAAFPILRPFLSQFALVCPTAEIPKELEKKGIPINLAIIDYPAEDVQANPEDTTPEAQEKTITQKIELTRSKYLEVASNPQFKQMAIKMSGLCPGNILASGDMSHPQIKRALEITREVCETAQKNDITVFADAENFAIEDTCYSLFRSVQDDFQSTLFVTLQATRKDSLDRLKALGDENRAKIVNGSYPEDRSLYPEHFHQSEFDTHTNFLLLATYSSRKNLLCTHNERLTLALGELGYTRMGNLMGVDVSKRYDPTKEVLLYVPTAAKDDIGVVYTYYSRRLGELSEPDFKPRKEEALFAELQERLKSTYKL